MATIAELTDVVLDAHLTDATEQRDAIVIDTFHAHDVLIFAYKPGQQVWGDPFDPEVSSVRRSEIVRGLRDGCGKAMPLARAARHISVAQTATFHRDIDRAILALEGMN